MSILDEIVVEWEKDAKIDKCAIQDEILKTPNLFAKYIKILSSWKQKRTAIQIKLDQTKQDIRDYYSGKWSLQKCKDRGRSQYQGIVPVKAVLDSMVNADNDVTKVISQLEMVDNIIYIVEQIVTSIKSRDFVLGTYTKYQMFLNGTKV